MINVWHLLWIVPVAAVVGFVTAAKNNTMSENLWVNFEDEAQTGTDYHRAAVPKDIDSRYCAFDSAWPE